MQSTYSIILTTILLASPLIVFMKMKPIHRLPFLICMCFAIPFAWSHHQRLELLAPQVIASFYALMAIQALVLIAALAYFLRSLVVRSIIKSKVQEMDQERRDLLSLTIPITATAMGRAGTTPKAPILRQVSIQIPQLPAQLDGLTILHISDIHLGRYIGLEQVEKVLDLLHNQTPDLIVLTGDIADDPALLGPALEKLVAVQPAYGLYACMGNHEIYPGRERFEAIYKDSGVDLLINEGRKIAIGDHSLWICGLDDPARTDYEHGAFYAQGLNKALEDRPQGIDVTLALCHRPEGFKVIDANHAMDLMLSGHTHGGQIAIDDRSLFEGMGENSYLMGHYEKEGSQLFVTAGLGHWFPYRVNCPCEGVLITLEGGQV